MTDTSTGPPRTAGEPIAVGNLKRFLAFLLGIVLFAVTLGIGFIIWSFIIWGNGQTPSKQLMGMRCVDNVTGEVADWGTMALREVIGRWLLGFVPLYTLASALVILFSSERRGFWDMIAGTVVVDDTDIVGLR